MTTEISHIFNHSSCLTANEIEQYVSGTLNEKDMRRVELHLADCPMCSDEIDGYTLLKDKNKLPIIVRELNEQIDNKISNGKIIPLKSSRKKINKRIFSIAASLILLLGAGFVINFYLNNADNNLAEVPETAIKINENTVPNNTDENVSAKNEKIQTESIEKESENNEIETINIKPGKQEEIISSTETDKNSDNVNNAVSESNEYTSEANDEDITSDNEIIDDTGTGEIAVEESTTENNNYIAAVPRNEKSINSENKKSAENISFMTTRGADLKRKSTIDKKEIEKYKSLRESALLSYGMKIWDEALKDFNSYLKYKPNDYEILYKSGISYYNLKKYNKAVLQFDKVISEGINRYVENAEWYKAKSLVKLGKNSEAKIILNSIIVNNKKYQNQALDLLNSLD